VHDRAELTAIDQRRVRAVTHLDVDAEAIDRALSAIAAEL
jgi:threonine aldolase